jgi:hypothetical protein
MNEEQHVKLVDVGDHFWDQISRLIGKAVSQFPEEIEDEVIAYLGERSSVYGSEYKKYVNREEPRKKLSLDMQIKDLQPYLSVRARKALIRYGWSKHLEHPTVRDLLDIKPEDFDKIKNAGLTTSIEIFDFFANFPEFDDPINK